MRNRNLKEKFLGYLGIGAGCLAVLGIVMYYLCILGLPILAVYALLVWIF